MLYVDFNFQVTLFILQTAHPYFNRVSYSEGSRYYSEGAYMASHHWDRVVGIQTACMLENFMEFI